MDTGSQNETDGGAQTETSSAASGRESHNVLLRVECISGRSIKANALGPSECVQRKRWPPDKQPRTGLQSFLIIQFFLRWIAVGIWLLFAILAFHRSFYYARERTNLHLATGVSAPFLVMACWALFSLASRVLKVCRAKQIWYAECDASFMSADVCRAANAHFTCHDRCCFCKLRLSYRTKQRRRLVGISLVQLTSLVSLLSRHCSQTSPVSFRPPAC